MQDLWIGYNFSRIAKKKYREIKSINVQSVVGLEKSQRSAIKLSTGNVAMITSITMWNATFATDKDIQNTCINLK